MNSLQLVSLVQEEATEGEGQLVWVQLQAKDGRDWWETRPRSLFLSVPWQVWASLGGTWKPVTDWVVLRALLWTCGRVNRFGPRWQTRTELSGKLGFWFINVVIQQVGAGSHGDSSITADTLCVCGLPMASMNVHKSQSSARCASNCFGFPRNLASFFPRHVYLCSESLAQDTSILPDCQFQMCSCVGPKMGC